MPDLTSKISRFNSFDLESYLNNTFQRYEGFILENERHNISKIEHEVDTELLKTFLLNSDSLLDILNVYEESYRMVTSMVDLTKELVRYNMDGGVEEEVFVDKDLVRKFRRVLDNFDNEVDVFATEGRYLVHFDILREKSGKECILIMTNDILLIGIVQEGAKKYRLLNAYSYSIIQIQIKDDLLEIKVSPTVYVFEKNKESVEYILRIYQELTYTYKKKTDSTVQKPVIDKELIDYLVFTEQYEYIEADECFHSPKVLFHDKTEMVRYLSVISKGKKGISPYVFSFLEERFKDGLKRINKIQPLKSFIEDIFGYFRVFLEEQTILVKDLEKIESIKRSGMVFLIEEQLVRCIEMLESRVFNKGYDVKYTDSILEAVKENLVFSKYDFSYIMDRFLKKRNNYKKKCLGNAMKDIGRIIEDMISN
ncbi:uncharacterized protein Eint_101750 [Encephalitozoon intestinalis ATCC 50506]|uniref:Uncharacterized protein n=1 Tax=Encephalitozoon intestinalis (strain ATCC 50506) TaxID=876142 RepID=E0S9W5_ENCIT|nr:uncharacterized protein Eint_101750 [Encephalitozoon intestinalis ATCC 50506]ADM12500.1 hypothetical protein Eint_101750 [Encephalitozoon intestinalis ATCC 50506]UTX46337.1 hypothetical protein GPK93_10g19370 [Encephalitozoon intestinalis]